jgi:hypothetical protein
VAARASISGALALFAAGAILAAASCASLIGLEPYGATGGANAGGAGGPTSHGGGDTASNGGAATTSTGSGRDCAGSCVAPPAGWLGPVAIEDGTACSAGDLQASAFLAPDQCPGCTCVADGGCQVEFDEYQLTDPTCMKALGTLFFDEGCNESPLSPGGSVIFGVKVAATAPASCTLADGCQMPPARPISLCEPKERCEDGRRCFPKDTPACIYNDDPTSICPKGFTSRDEVGDSNVMVMECHCGSTTPMSTDCTPQKLVYFKESACGGDAVHADLGGCGMLGGPSLVYKATDEGTCSAPRPEVVSTPRYRICCAG